jgi:hypothetical protein
MSRRSSWLRSLNTEVATTVVVAVLWAEPPPQSDDTTVRLALKTRPRLEFLDERRIIVDPAAAQQQEEQRIDGH